MTRAMRLRLFQMECLVHSAKKTMRRVRASSQNNRQLKNNNIKFRSRNRHRSRSSKVSSNRSSNRSSRRKRCSKGFKMSRIRSVFFRRIIDVIDSLCWRVIFSISRIVLILWRR